MIKAKKKVVLVMQNLAGCNKEIVEITVEPNFWV